MTEPTLIIGRDNKILKLHDYVHSVFNGLYVYEIMEIYEPHCTLKAIGYENLPETWASNNKSWPNILGNQLSLTVYRGVTNSQEAGNFNVFILV